uniref:Uncharacterized protein n=1 Tax=Tetranychus urticae TaxID=32264 RepID=T1JSR8_TETUR
MLATEIINSVNVDAGSCRINILGPLGNSNWIVLFSLAWIGGFTSITEEPMYISKFASYMAE